MSTIAIRDEFEQERAVSVVHTTACVLDGLVASNDVHSVRLYTRNLVTAREVLRVGRRPFRRCAHTVLVVLADKHAREVPQLRHVERLEDLALVARAIAVQRERRVLLILVVLRECDARAHGNLCADDAVSAKEPRGEDVHGPALAVRHATLATKELTDDALDCANRRAGRRRGGIGRQ